MTQDAWNPQQYEKFKAERAQPFFDLKALLRPVAAPHIVDLGCGTGELTADLHGSLKAAATTGLDSSEKMLARARAHEGGGLSFTQGDIDAWTAEGAFDIVFSNAALQWCDTPHEELFARLRRALRDGGQLAVQAPLNYDHPTQVVATAMSREAPWSGKLGGAAYDKAAAFLPPEGYAALLHRLGFREQKVFLRVYAHILPSREEAVEWVKGTSLSHFAGRLEAADYAAFLAEYRRRVFALLPDDRPFFFPFKRLLIWGAL